MNLQQLLPSAGLMLVVGSLHAQGPSRPSADAELFNTLRKKPSQAVIRDGERLDVVNARYEPCTKKKDAHYIRVITLTPNGTYDVRVMSPNGSMLMRGSYADALGHVPDGAFLYYDDGGTLRAQGNYVNGQKTGTWHRSDDRGAALSDKYYTGLDWDGMLVSLGLASMSTTQQNELARK